jgi:ABC-type multidrug transport system permease subunit
MFFTLVFFGLASLSAADRLAAESAVRAREIQSGYHGAGSYVVSALVTDVLCLRVPAAAAYAAVFYFLMGLKPEASAFFVFLGVLELFVMCTAAMSSLISLCFDAPAVANLIATSVQLLGAMFGGFLVSVRFYLFSDCLPA